MLRITQQVLLKQWQYLPALKHFTVSAIFVMENCKYLWQMQRF